MAGTAVLLRPPGCIETFLSGRGCRRALRRARALDGARRSRRPRCAATRAPRRPSISTRGASRKALASVINLLDPDVIVLGGGLSNIEALYERVPRYWTDWVFSDQVDTRLVRARHGDSSGVRGAAWLWPV